MKVGLPEDLMAEIEAGLEPDETLESFVTQALHQYLTVRENRGSQGGNVYFEPTGLLRASLILHTRHIKATQVS